VEKMNCKVKGSLRNVKIIYILFLYIFSSVIFAHQASANNLSVSGVAFGDRDPVNDKLNIKIPTKYSSDEDGDNESVVTKQETKEF
jgi:hypothetical protein